MKLTRLIPVLAVLIPTLAWGQGPADEWHDRLENERGVLSFSLNHDFEDFFDGVFDFEDHEYELQGDVHHINFTVASSNADVPRLYRNMLNALSRSDFEEIHLEDEDADEVRIWVERDGSHITQIHVLIGKQQTEDNGMVFATLYGDMILTE